MRNLVKLVILFILSIVKCEDNLNFNEAVPIEVERTPTIFVPILIRNKAHILPYFFSYFENLDYPKNKISLWIRSDHNEDNSIEITKLWLNRVEKLYHNVDFAYDETEKNFNFSTSRVDWSNDRFSHIIALKEEAMEFARKSWADFVFFCDVDIILTNPKTLIELINLKLPIVAPMLQSSNLIYSNFWAAMTNYYYGRAAEYFKIAQLKNIGEFNVPMVHSAVLISLNHEPTKLLTFDRNKLIQTQLENNFEEVDYNVPFDDIIVFAIAAKSFNIPLAISNSHSYGFISIPASESFDEELSNFVDLKVIVLTKTEEDLLVNEEFKHLITYPKKHRLSFDNIYMINLERRPERRLKMDRLLRELGLEYEYFKAVDGNRVSEFKRKLNKMKIAVALTVLCFAVTYASPQFGFGGLASGFASNIPRVPNLPLANRLSSIAQIPSLSSVRDFGQFVAQSGKSYATAAERTLREGIFAAKDKLVEANNAGNSGYTLAHNFFSDLSKGEFLQKLTGNRKSSAGEQLKSKNRKSTPKAHKAIPESWDWREHGAVTPVKFQGKFFLHLKQQTNLHKIMQDWNVVHAGHLESPEQLKVTTLPRPRNSFLCLNKI
ncbi:CERCAM family protein [Megaselia abdita]